tara:strand:+ start:2613 stop:6080 length:3468 start_codon:yes stop_codon:yes gene_type:complete
MSRWFNLILFAALPTLPELAKANTYIEMMTVHLDAPVTQLAPPTDSAFRKKSFAQRNSPEEVEKLAHELFTLWDWNQKACSRMSITHRLKNQKEEITKLYAQKRYQDALDTFRAYFFAKVQLLWNDEKGLVSRDFEGRHGRDYTIKNYEDNVTLLMENIYQARTTKETVHLGEMGALRWDWQPEGLQNPWYIPTVFEYFASEHNFRTLWWKFIDTEDKQYLDKYLEYYDDYTINYRFQENLNPLNLDYGKQGHGNIEHFIHSLSEIARVLPASGKGFPSTTLARILIRQLTVVLPQSVYYNREQSGNHSCGAVHVQQYLSSFLYDFKIAKILEHESRRQFELYNTLVDLPDGSMYGRSAGYSRHEFTENGVYINKIREADLEWLTPAVELEFQDRLADRVFWYFNLFDAGGEHLNGVAAGRRNMDFTKRVNLVEKFQPGILRNKSLQALASTILRNQTKPDWNGQTHTHLGNPLLNGGLFSYEPPPYTSISFPYNHISIMRSGWDAQKDQAGIFLHSSGRGLDGGLFLRAKNCNSLTLSAFNQTLLVNGIEYAYNYVRSPIQVDNQDQFARAGLTGHARKGEHQPGLVTISPWRNHHSPFFDVAEGRYDGIYSDSPDHEPMLYHYNTNLKVLNNALEGIPSHHRIVYFVKEFGLWFILDIMEADRAHSYRQQWWMSKLTDKNPEGYKEDWVSSDAERKMIYSHAENKPNLSMYHVGPVLLEKNEKQHLRYDSIKTYVKQKEWFKGYRADRREGVKFLHLTTQWQSQRGKSQLITVLYPRQVGRAENVLQVERAKNGKEVSVTMPNGSSVHFVAEGLESVLTVSEKDQDLKRGLVLSESENYEFVSDGLGEKRIPIYRPIGELLIRPDRSVFADEITVSITGPEDNVEIHYTTDGSDPGLDSPLYVREMTFDKSVKLKVRAFRKNLDELAVNQAGNTLMSRVYRASFTKASPHEPLPDELAAKLNRGLKYNYFEEQWPKLLFGPPANGALKNGTVDSAFDTKPRSNKKNRAFAFHYTGYFKAPVDGVYTLYAPPEFIKYAPLAGYDLDVHLGFQNNWNQGVKLDVGPETPLQHWYPGTHRHSLGNWSINLKKGFHPIEIYFADIRSGGHLEYMQFDYDGVNVPGLIPRYWDGDLPKFEISGPGLNRQSLPPENLYH